MIVSELIDPQTNSWSLNMFTALFDQQTLNSILKIFPSNNNDDFI